MINAQNIAKWPFPVNSTESGMPTGHGKLEQLSELPWKLQKSYEVYTGLQSQQFLLVQQYATHGLPSVKDSKRRRQRRFLAFFSFISSHQLISSSKSTRARIHLIALGAIGALGAECLSTPRIAFTNKTQEGNVKCPSSTGEDTNSQRPTHIQAFSDDWSWLSDD